MARQTLRMFCVITHTPGPTKHMYKICMRHSVTAAPTCPIILLLRELSFYTAKDGFVERLEDVSALWWQ